MSENLLFLHLPKNGGNTLHSVINRMYSTEEIFDIKVINNTRLNTDEFIDLSFENRKKIKVLKGHMLYGLHKHLIGESKYITFLRKPEDRIVSFFHYVKARPQHRLYQKLADQNFSFSEFVKNSTEGDIHNAQIRWISGLEHGTEDEMLSVAIENYQKHFSFIGFQEYFNESLLLLAKKYGWGIPYYKFQNKGNYKKQSFKLDTASKALIAERNKGDTEFYNTVYQGFKQQLRHYKNVKFSLKKLDWFNKAYSNPYTKKIVTKLF